MVEEQKSVIPKFLIVGILLCLVIVVLGTFFVSQSNISAAWTYANQECVKQGWERAYTIEATWFSDKPIRYNCVTYSSEDLNVQAA